MTTSDRRRAAWSFSCSLIIAAALGFAAPAPAAAAETADPLKVINQQFRTIYAARRAATLKAAQPYMIVKFDALELHINGARREANFTPRIYHEVKAVSHVTLAVVAALAGRNGALDAGTRAQLTKLRGLIPPAAASLDKRGWPAPVVATHQAMLTASAKFLDTTLAAGRASSAGVTAFARSMQPYVLESGRVAAEAQLNGLHALVTRWRRDMGPANWRRLYVVNLVPRQAAPGNLQYTYFKRAMGKGAEGVRLFQAENIFSAKGATRMLGTIVLDRKASVAFFGNSTRLERDFLADAAAAHVATLFGDERK